MVGNINCIADLIVDYMTNDSVSKLDKELRACLVHIFKHMFSSF